MSNILKYRLKELRLAQKKSCRYMATKCQVTEMTYRSWELIQMDESKSIPSDHLRILSKDLDVIMDELYAFPVLG